MLKKYDVSNYSLWNVNNTSAIEYLNDVTEVLAKYSWIYNGRNTEIFLYDVLEMIPIEWCEALIPLPLKDLCQLPFNLLKDEWPDSLRTFVTQCQFLGNLRFPAESFPDAIENSKETRDLTRKTSQKKLFEIEIMSNLIHKVCQEHKCQIVLDIGSGLGHLDKFLHHNFGLKCIGLDSVSKYTIAAKDRLKNDPCKNSIYHETLEVKNSEECFHALKAILHRERVWNCHGSSEAHFSEGTNRAAVMVGLHSCGNLMQDMMKLFCQIEELRAFICLGCCYNKINLADFPMSNAAQSSVSTTCTKYPKWQPCVSGLRLAAHGTRNYCTAAMMGSYVERSMFYRALLECYVQRENIIWHQPKRHLRTTDITDFKTYCNNMLKNHSLSGDKKTLDDLQKLHHQKQLLYPRIRILLILQTLLQPLWEGFITVDRMLYFREKSISTEVIAMWDDARSSRNLALCAYKS